MANGWLGGENQDVGSGDRQTRWLTPKYIVEALGQFDLDPAGAPGHSLADYTVLLENGQNGLTFPWEGRVWLNPPYGKEAEPFLKKMADHNNGTALLFARTETKMFFDYVWTRASALLFLKGRLNFLNAAGERAKANAGAPSVLVAYGADDARQLLQCDLEGAFIDLRKNFND